MLETTQHKKLPNLSIYSIKREKSLEYNTKIDHATADEVYKTIVPVLEVNQVQVMNHGVSTR